MKQIIQQEKLTETLTLTQWPDGFWLHDKTRGINLSMRAMTPTAAFLEALIYYQRRLTQVESEHKAMREKVDAFVSQFTKEDY